MRDRESYDCHEYCNIISTEKKPIQGNAFAIFWLKWIRRLIWIILKFFQEHRPPRQRARTNRIRLALHATLHRGRKSRPTPTRHRRRFRGFVVVATIFCWRILATLITPPSVWRVSPAHRQLFMIIKNYPLLFCRWCYLVRCPLACVIFRCWKEGGGNKRRDDGYKSSMVDISDSVGSFSACPFGAWW
jgi:hypothetical protein